MFRASSSLLSRPGLWAAAAALLAQRLLHAAFIEAPFAPYAIAEWVVRKTPGPLATWAIEQLGHSALRTIGYIAIGMTLVIGITAGRRPAWAIASVAFLLTVLAARLDPLSPGAGGTLASACLAAAVAYTVAFALQPIPSAPAREQPDLARRRLVVAGGLGLLLVGLLWTAGVRHALRMVPVRRVRADQPATVPSDPSFVEVPGLSPKVTSREDHYVVDIDLEDPVVDEGDWRLQVTGRVQTPLSFTLSDLEAMSTTEELFNLSCISNNVGGDLVSNSLWTGVSLDRLLDMASVQPDAQALLVRAVDGYHEGIALVDIRGVGAMVAIAMDGETLPRSHGFPARLLFPNHYGMRNVKWLADIVLLDQFEQGYWAQRGWNKDAVVRTESRIDAPSDGRTVSSPFTCAGIAWAGKRGIEKVEVSTNDGESWREAQLETALAPFSWRRWQVSLDLPPGEHPLTVRATDGTGQLQDELVRPPHPSGASGYHRITITVAST